jgi:hypothetical protein
MLGIPEALFLASGLARHHIGTDFGVFYAASRLVHSGELAAISTPASLTAAAEAVLGRSLEGGVTYPWPYPPTALLVVFPLAFLSLWPAYLAAMSLGVAAYLSSMVALVRHAGSKAEAVLVLLAFPGVAAVIVWGHSSFVTTALLGWAIALLPASPVLAGCAVGLLSFKPHLGVLVPVALLAGRHRIAALSAAATAVVLAGVATIAFGWQTWASFLQAAPLMVTRVEVAAATNRFYQSAFSAVRLAGGGVTAAWVAQGIVAIAAAWVVWRTWSADGSWEQKGTVLVLATVLATPYLCEYDLLLLAIPIALGLGAALDGRWPWMGVVVAALLTPAIAPACARLAGLAIAPCVAAALLWAVQRSGRGRRARSPLATERAMSPELTRGARRLSERPRARSSDPR